MNIIISTCIIWAENEWGNGSIAEKITRADNGSKERRQENKDTYTW
jgi:hypothetical protein